MQLGMQQHQRVAAGQQRGRSCARPCRAFTPAGPSSSGRVATRHVCHAKLDEVSLFADSSMLGPSSKNSSAAAAAGGVETVELKSKVCAWHGSVARASVDLYPPTRGRRRQCAREGPRCRLRWAGAAPEHDVSLKISPEQCSSHDINTTLARVWLPRPLSSVWTTRPLPST
jgi:hypothetical protein